jgi:hypothetical protein
MRKICYPAGRHSLRGGWASARKPAAVRLSAGIGTALISPGGDPGTQNMKRVKLVLGYDDHSRGLFPLLLCSLHRPKV